MSFVDTHCHIHSSDYTLSIDSVLSNSMQNSVNRIITMSTDLSDLYSAERFCQKYDGLYGIQLYYGAGIYPHDLTDNYKTDIASLAQFIAKEKDQHLVAIGEVGLDLCYDGVAITMQQDALERFCDLSVQHNLPLSLHVRSGKYGNAFDHLWPILNNFPKARGVFHSFADNTIELDKLLKLRFYIGVNGIMTFNKDIELEKVFKNVPLDRIVLETDSPYLAPVGYRGKPNQPKHIKNIAMALCKLRGVSLEHIAAITTSNARHVFGL